MAATEQGTTVARNYAEALLTLARKAEDPAGWSNMLRQVANAIQSDATLRHFLESPRIAGDAKADVLTKALSDRVPRLFMRFIQTLVQNRRQSMIPRIADEYETLLDESLNIVHARVTVAKPLSDDEGKALADSLSRTIGRQVVPHVEVQPAILGGVIVRMGDVVMDGSLRRKLNGLKRRMSVKS
jgi:F-type H+-transporting ATPase subunit delta